MAALLPDSMLPELDPPGVLGERLSAPVPGGATMISMRPEPPEFAGGELPAGGGLAALSLDPRSGVRGFGSKKLAEPPSVFWPDRLFSSLG